MQFSLGNARDLIAKAVRWFRSSFAPPLPETATAPGEAASLAFLDARSAVRTGGIIVAGFVLFFFGWAAFAPLDSAVMAPGVVVVESHRKTIQHLEGGIVRQIRVKEGQAVRAGDLLVQLDDTQARAQLNLIEGEADALTAQQARLTAERDQAATIAFPPELVARSSDPKVAEAIAGEQRAFATRRDTWRRQAQILTSRKAENARINAGLKSQEIALDTQLGLIGKETGMIEQLVQRGIEGMPRLLALQRQTAQLGGQRGEVVEKMAQVTLDTGEIDLQLINLQNEARGEILRELREVQTKRFDLMERLRAARDVLNRQSILSPDHGRVVGLAVHTQGAVVRAGETMLEIVPQDDQLDIDAHVPPEDIDDLQIGVPAKVTLTAYKQNSLPMITGIVTAVSADRLVDQRTGMPYFNAKVAVDRGALADYPAVRLVPGMPVEVAIETGSRTMLEYLLAPISGVMRRGMRER